MTEQRRARSTEAFFGRRRGRPVGSRQTAALASELPRYRLDLTAPAPANLATLFRAPVESVHLEIGFGGGERLLHACALHPERGHIGIEPFVNGLARLTLALAGQPVPNLRLHDDDATQLLDWLPEASLAGIDLFYPDPWPKPRHWKRRFVNAANLDRFAHVLRSGGTFRFASDIPGYVDWTLEHVGAHPSFAAVASTSAGTPFEDWVRTRYEAKAIREGRSPAYLRFRRL